MKKTRIVYLTREPEMAWSTHPYRLWKRKPILPAGFSSFRSSEKGAPVYGGFLQEMGSKEAEERGMPIIKKGECVKLRITIETIG